ncbi:hypothetical protein ACFVSN_30955 [Kitasatospora sp. NPDC057904]|uniref:hypothetical protein n=1 Tax=Kitasatospora sp. NPDC057904 TaxID=3346275 RepID=UPI0036DA67AB
MAAFYPFVRAAAGGQGPHLGLTPKQTFCRRPVLGPTGEQFAADGDPADVPCPECREDLAAYRLLAARKDEHTLTWNPELVPLGRTTALHAQATLTAAELLARRRTRRWETPETQQAEVLLGLLREITDARTLLSALSDDLTLALRDLCRPAPSWERIGEALGVSATPARHRYARAAEANPDRPVACGIGGTGCGDLRQAQLPDGSDPWKHHEDEHDGNPELPQQDEDE